MILRDFRPSDFTEIVASATEDDVKVDAVGRGRAFTVWNGDVPVMCGGVREIFPTTGEAWLFASSKISKTMRARALVTFAEQAFDLASEGYTCVLAMSRREFGNPRLLKNLGFKRVGVVAKYMPNDKDVVLFVRST